MNPNQYCGKVSAEERTDLSEFSGWIKYVGSVENLAYRKSGQKNWSKDKMLLWLARLQSHNGGTYFMGMIDSYPALTVTRLALYLKEDQDMPRQNIPFWHKNYFELKEMENQ